MRQKLRLGDSYALSATNHTRNNDKRKPGDNHLSSHIYPMGIHQLSNVNAVHLSWTTTVYLLHNYWINTVESLLDTCGGYVEREYVCTHAKVPARSGLGLALGMMLLQVLCLEARGQRPEDSAVVTMGESIYTLSTVISETVTDAMNLNRILKFVPDANLDRFPVRKYHVETGADFRGLSIGDTIPDAVWNLPLWVVNHPDGKDTIKLDDYRNEKLLVLDFWAK